MRIEVSLPYDVKILQKELSRLRDTNDALREALEQVNKQANMAALKCDAKHQSCDHWDEFCEIESLSFAALAKIKGDGK